MHSRQSDNMSLTTYPVVQTKLKHLTCANCKHAFCLRGSHHFRGKIPMLLQCGHPVCEICVKTCPVKTCTSCGIVYHQNLNEQPTFLVNLYILGLIWSNQLVSTNRMEPNVEFQQPTAARFRKSATDDLEYLKNRGNFIAQSLQQPCTRKMKVKRSAEEHCSECGLKADSRCRQCEVFFCNSCYTKIHGRALQNHQKMSLEESAINICNFLSSKCEQHPAETVQLFCTQCNVPTCTLCILLSHQTHTVIRISDKVNESKSQIEEVIAKLAETLQRVKQTEKKLAKPHVLMNTSQDSDTDREKIEAQLAQHFVYLHGVLQNIENRFMTQLQEQQNYVRNNINAIKEQLNEQKEVLENAILLATSALKSDAAMNVTAIINKLEQALNVPCHLVHNHFSDDKIELNIDESIVDVLEEHCTIELPSVSTYSLAKAEELPEDYEIEPILQEEIPRPALLAVRPAQSTLSRSSLSTSTMSLRAVDQKQNGSLVAGSSEAVRITHIKDPNCFYTQLICQLETLNQLHKALAKQAATSATPNELELNKMYLVQYGIDMKWYRGRVKTLSKDAKNCQVCDIFYVDYGNAESSVPIKRMRNMSVQSSLVPILARQCTLHDIVPKGDAWEIDANKVMYAMVDDISHAIMHIFKVCNDVYHVDILKNSFGDGDNTFSIRDALIFLEYGTFITDEKLRKTSSQSVRKFFEEEIAIEHMYDVRLTHCVSPDCIYVQKIGGGMTHLMKLTNDMMAEYGKIASNKGIIYNPEIGMPCAALYSNGSWYRGRISKLLGNRKVEVFFVDYGDTCEYNYDEIRRLHYKFMTVTALAFKISLKDVAPLKNNEWPLETKEFMIDKLDSTFLKIFVFSRESDCYKVTLYIPLDNKDVNFNTLLVKEKFAESTGSSSQFIDIPRTIAKKRKNRVSKTKKFRPHGIEDTNLTHEVDDSDPFRMQVNVLQVVSPDCIYVSDVQSTKCMKKMIEEIQDFYNKYKSAESEDWEKDNVCIAYSAKDKSYHRSKIVEIIPPEEVVVFLYDIGITETVTLQDLQSLHPKFSTIPPRAIKVKLAGILPCGGSVTWLSSSCEILSDLVNENQHSRFYISKVAEIEDDALSVDLWVQETRTEGALAPTIVEINSINRKLVKKGVALPVRGYKEEKDKVLAIELRQQILQYDNNSTVSEVEWMVKNQLSSYPSDVTNHTSVLASSNEMSVSDLTSENDDNNHSNTEPEADVESEEEFAIPPALSAWIPPAAITDNRFCAIATNVDHNCTIYLHSLKYNSDTLALINTTLQAHFAGSKPKACDIVWAPNDMCIAQYHVDKKWYRAQVLEVLDNDEIKVIFVDYGNVDECKVGTLRKRVIMGHIPIQATKCVVHGLIPDTQDGRWSTSELDVIHALVVDKKSDVTVLKRQPDHLVISMTLRSFKNMDLVTYLKYELNFKISELVLEVSSQGGSHCADTELDSLDNADVVVGEYVDYIPETIAGAPVFELYLNLEETSPEKIEDGKCKDLISGSINITDNQEPIDLDSSTKTSHNSDVVLVSDNASNISSCGMGSSEKSINVSWTPQNEENDPFIPCYTYINIPDDVQVIDLEILYFMDPIVFFARIDDACNIKHLHLYKKQAKLMDRQMQRYASDQPMLCTISLNTPCCAQYVDSQWYRALITEIKPDSENVTVKYVDFGNSEEQSIDTLRSLTESWLAVPVLSLECKLWRIRVNPEKPDWKTQDEKFRSICRLGVSYTAKIKERFVGKLSVELYSDESCTKLLYDHLLEEELLQATEE